MENKLMEIDREQWPQLRDLYTNRKRYASSYNLLQCMIDWMNKNPELDMKIYSLNDEWQDDGTFVLEFSDQIFCNTLNEDQDRLRKALKNLDLSKKYLISGFQQRILPAIQIHFHDSNIPNEAFKAEVFAWYHIERVKALAFKTDPPANMIIKTLTALNSKQVNNAWPYRSSDSESFIKILIDNNESVGIYENGKLLAWCLRVPLGSIGLLQVEDSHKRKGLGSLTVRYMAKLLASKNIEICASVAMENSASRSLFTKLGFEIIDLVYWAHKPASVE